MQRNITWVKKGDFSRAFNSGGELIRQVEYKNVTNEPRVKVFIGGYYSGSRRVIFRSKELIDGFLNKCKEAKLFVEDDFCARNLGSTDVTVDSTSKQDKKQLAQFINCIDSVIPLGKDIKKEIFNTLNLDQISDEKSFYDELEKLIDDGNVEEVIKKAKSVDDDHVFWKLGLYCEEKQKFSEAISIYQEIDKNNPHYYEANQQSACIVMQYLSAIDQSKQQLSQQEKRQNQEAEFKFLLRGNNHSCNQPIIDQHYHQLCGGSDLNPTIKNVGCNEETLISLASQTSVLKNENHQLQQKNIEQLAKIEELNNQIEQLKRSTRSTSNHSNAFFDSPQKNDDRKPNNTHTYCGLI
jgi:tetratricopeptide (TPR) repeat protein